MSVNIEIGLKKISELRLPAFITSKLAKQSILTVNDLTALCDREILSISGIGEREVKI